MNVPAVLLVEDEPAVRRFVEAALEDLGIALHMTDNVAQAIAWLEAAPFALVLTDLMLHGASGRDLVRHLQRQPGLGGGPRVAVLSAGLAEPVRAELLQLGAWRMLDKPVPLAQLRQCVRDAIATASLPAHTAQAVLPRHVPPDPPQPPPPADVVQAYFGGNARLYNAYRAACEAQFVHDLAEGERAFAASDRVAMCRLAHNLKTVLLSLGHASGAHSAKAIDAGCQAGDWSAVQTHWPALRAALCDGSGDGSAAR